MSNLKSTNCKFPPNLNILHYGKKLSTHSQVHVTKLSTIKHLLLPFLFSNFLACLIYHKNMKDELKSFLKILILNAIVLRANVKDRKSNVKIKVEVVEKLLLTLMSRSKQKLQRNQN